MLRRNLHGSLSGFTDSDSDTDIYTTGVTHSSNGNTFTDCCINSTAVKKFYCSGGTAYGTTKSCPSIYPCVGGRCS